MGLHLSQTCEMAKIVLINIPLFREEIKRCFLFNSSRLLFLPLGAGFSTGSQRHGEGAISQNPPSFLGQALTEGTLIFVLEQQFFPWECSKQDFFFSKSESQDF